MKGHCLSWLALTLAMVASVPAMPKTLDAMSQAPASPRSPLWLATALRSTPLPTQKTSCAQRCLSNSYFLFNVTGSGATCTDARNDLTSQLYSIAGAKCAQRYPLGGQASNGMVCLLSQEYPQPCTELSPSVFQVPGAAIYSCSAFFCI
jgi:hypothetical protein